MTRKQLLPFLMILVLLFAACTNNEGEDFTEPIRPQIILISGDTSLSGQVTNSCWPEGTNNVRCDPSFDTSTPPLNH